MSRVAGLWKPAAAVVAALLMTATVGSALRGTPSEAGSDLVAVDGALPTEETLLPAIDGVPEVWVVGPTTIEGEDRTYDARIRVLPGSSLTVDVSTLRFGAHPNGPTGIVAEPGSEVIITGSTLTTATPGSYIVHLEGIARIEASTIDGVRSVIAQPRSTTDHVDDLLGSQLEGDVPGWRVVRTLTQATFLLSGSTVVATTGPALVAATPVQYEASLPPTLPAVRVMDSVVSAVGGPAVLCYATHQDPDPDSGQSLPPVAGEPFTELLIERTTLESATGPVLNCPPAPQPVLAPARTLPPGVLVPTSPVRAAPPPLSSGPEALPGPALLRLDAGTVRGDAIGLLLDGATRVESTGTHFEGLSPAVRVSAATASASLVDVTGAGLGLGFDVSSGSLTVDGAELSGTNIDDGLRVTGGTATLEDAIVRDFRIGVAALAPATVRATSFEGMTGCVTAQGAAIVVETSTFTDCHVGVLLAGATGATVRSNAFLDTRHPLHVESVDPAAHPEHYRHTVSGNTVEGLGIAYVVEDDGRTITNRVGSAIVAHTDDARIAKLDARVGHWHVVASDDVVIGAPTDAQVDLLARADPVLAAAFAQAWQGVRFELYPGAMKGPRGAEEQGSANDVDQAWLLVDRARALGHDARFVEGTSELSTAAYLNWVGMDDLGTALTILGLSGFVIGNTLHMDRTWAEIEVEPGLWLEADPAFIQYERLPMAEPVEADQQAMLGELEALLDATPGTPGHVTSMPFAQGEASRDTVLEPLARAWVEETVGAAETPGDVLGGLLPTQVATSIEPTRAPQTRLDAISDAHMWSVDLQMGSTRTVRTTPELYGERISIFSVPATPGDEATIDAAGGLTNVARFSVNMVTDLYVGGEPVARDATPRHPGDEVYVAVDVRMPGPQFVLTHDSPIRVGGGYAIALEFGHTPLAALARETTQWETVVDRITGGDIAGIDHDDAILPVFQLQGMYYFNKVGLYADLVSSGQGVMSQPLVSAAVTGMQMVPVISGGVQKVAPTPPYIDVQFLGNRYARDGDATAEAQFSYTTGMYSSMWEGLIFEELYGIDAINTVDILQAAAEAGQPLHYVSAENVGEIMAQTNLPFVVESAIFNAVFSGMDVVVHDAQVTVGTWSGVAWNEVDPETGLGGWLIYGGSTPLGGDQALVTPTIMFGGSGTSWADTAVWVAKGIEALARSVLQQFGGEDGKFARDFLRYFKLGITMGTDIGKAVNEPGLNNWGKGCLAAQMVGIDVGLMFLGRWLGTLLLPKCIAWALAGTLFGGLFGLIAAFAVCILITALLIMLIGQIVKWIHDALYDLEVSQCDQITEGMP